MDDYQMLGMAQAAAHWWRRTLEEGRAPSLLADAGWGREGASRNEVLGGVISDGLIGMIRKNSAPVTAEQLDLFEWGLALQVLGAAKHLAPGRTLPFLSTDYHPCGAIYEAGKAAGIEERNFDIRFPFKVHMRITDEEVAVSAGYRAEYESLVQTKRAVIADLVAKRVSELTYPKGEIDFDSPEWKRHEACRKRAWAMCTHLSRFPSGEVDTIVAAIVDGAITGEW